VSLNSVLVFVSMCLLCICVFSYVLVGLLHRVHMSVLGAIH